MTKFSIVLASALTLAACGCDKKGGGGDCGKAIANSMAVSKSSMSAMGVDGKTLEKMHDLGVKHCTDDKWPDEAIKCMTDAKTEGDAQGCYGKMPADLSAKMNKDAMALMASTMAAKAGAAPAAGSGVTAGSGAGSGSAAPASGW